MTKILWDQLGDRRYETGVSKGVLYKTDGYGVPWNGITSVEQSVSNESEPVSFDGVKFTDVVTLGDFTAVLRAFTYPDEFLMFEGTLEDVSGLFILNQPQSYFGLSYRTESADDINSFGPGYKIHLLYNLFALPAQQSFQTLSLDVQPNEFEWAITSVPEDIQSYRPTAHIIFDSRRMDPYMMKDIESIIYGDENLEPRLPPLKGLISFSAKWGRLVITDNNDGTWEAYSPLDDVITMLDDTTFQIDSDTATYLDADTYTITSSELNLDDLWPPGT